MDFIITGGAGFIGSHLAEQLLIEGHTVTIVDNLATGSLKNLPQHPSLKLIKKDILECQPEDFLAPVDGIAHLAAIPSVSESWKEPIKGHSNNLSTTISVIQLCQSLGIPRLVFASSAAVYGNQTKLPISEDRETNPISPYGLQKLTSEKYAELFSQHMGMSTIVLRLFNVFGPRQVPNSPYSGVVSKFVSAMRYNQPLTIYGDGTQTRDFIYVKDVAKAFSTALTTPLLAGSCLTCNIATNKSTSILQLVDILKSCFPKWHSKIQFLPVETGDIQHSQADISKAFSSLVFAPQWSVEAGMKLLVDSIAIDEK